MIIVKLMGGLGNQMFQYAAGRRLAHKHNTQLKLDISFLKSRQEGYTPRTYELKHLNISEVIAKPKEIADITGKGISLYQNILFRFRQVAGLVNSQPNVYSERHFHFDPGFLTAPDSVYLDGYWQSEKYFADIADIIRQEFTVKTPQKGQDKDLAELIDSCDSVSLHIRRGDFVSNPQTNQVHGTCALDYYFGCVENLAQTLKNPHFFIFTDEPEWARDNLKLPFSTTLVDHNGADKNYEDMRLMSQCKHHIIANSSFSWWGAWLNPIEDKLVFAPKRWFTRDNLNLHDLIPNQWIKV